MFLHNTLIYQKYFLMQMSFGYNHKNSYYQKFYYHWLYMQNMDLSDHKPATLQLMSFLLIPLCKSILKIHKLYELLEWICTTIFYHLINVLLLDH